MNTIIKISDDCESTKIINCEINSQNDFDNAIRKFWGDIRVCDTVTMPGFDQYLKQYEDMLEQNPDLEPQEYTEYLYSHQSKNGVFPNIFKKFMRTKYVNIQIEDSVCQIYSEDRWNQLTKNAQETSTIKLWCDNDYYEYDDTEDKLASQYKED